MKKIGILLLISQIFTLQQLFAQQKPLTPIGGRPDLKGDLFLEFGFNTLNNKPDELKTDFFKSRTFNAYYYFEVKILGENSGLTLNPGLGFASDKYAFRNDQTLFNNPALGPNSSQLLPISDVYGDDILVRTNNVTTNFLEIPVEFRYHFNRNNYRKSIRWAFGGKFGYNFQSQTKIAYTDGAGLDRKIKDRQSFGFAPFRYGVYTRLGFSGFNLWGYYGLNQVFEKDKGPFKTQATQLNFGISVALF